MKRQIHMGRRSLRLTLCLTLILSLAAALVLPGTPMRSNAAGGTITMTIERFTLGGGFLMEPTKVPFNAGENYASVVDRTISQLGYTPVSSSGTQKGYYLQKIEGAGVNVQSLNVPKVILDKIINNKKNPIDLVKENVSENCLREMQYTAGAGWMYYVDGKWMNGMSDEVPKDGQVCRLSYTLYYGADLVDQQYDENMQTLNGEKYYDVADKTELVRAMGEMNADKAAWANDAAKKRAYAYAADVMAKVDAEENEVFKAEQVLDDPSLLPPETETPAVTESPSESQTPSVTDPTSESKDPTAADPSTESKEPSVTDPSVTDPADESTESSAADPTDESKDPATDPSKEQNEGKDVFTAGKLAVTVGKPSDSAVSLSWKEYDHADSYEVLRWASGSSKSTMVATVTGCSYTDKNVKPNTQYTYAVRAVSDDWGAQVYSQYERNYVKTPAKLTVGQVKSVKVSSAAYNKLKVSWGKVANAASYKVYRSTKSGSGYKAVKTVSGTSFTDTGLTTGQTYYYKVEAVRKADGKTVTGKQSAAKSGKPALGQVTKLSAKSSAKKKAALSWKKVSGATGYKVYRSAKKSSGYKCVKTQKGTGWTNTKLTSKKTYYYKVRAYRTVDGKPVYGSYSAVEKIKVK